MKRSGVRLMFGVLLVSVLVLGLPAAVSAGVNTCDDIEWCNWKHIEYNIGTTDNRCYTTDTPHSNYNNNTWWNCNTNQSMSDGMNDDLTSLKNEFNFTTLRWCSSSNMGGNCSNFGPNVADPYLGNNTVGNDQASSHGYA